ncbi:hypothetical protein D3C85_1349280 [compost metagenome]
MLSTSFRLTTTAPVTGFPLASINELAGKSNFIPLVPVMLNAVAPVPLNFCVGTENLALNSAAVNLVSSFPLSFLQANNVVITTNAIKVKFFIILGFN